MISLSIFDENTQDQSARRRELYLARLREISGAPDTDDEPPHETGLEGVLPDRLEMVLARSRPSEAPVHGQTATVKADQTPNKEDTMDHLPDSSSTEAAVDAHAAAVANVTSAPPDHPSPEQPMNGRTGITEQAGVKEGFSDSASPRANGGHSDKFQTMAERITPRLIEAVTGAIREVHNLAADDRKRLDAAITSITATSDRLEQLTAELTAARRSSETMAQAERSLSLKMARIEAHLRENDERQQSTKAELERSLASQAAMISALEERVRQIGQRLDAISDFSRINDHLKKLDESAQAQSESDRTIQHRLGVQAEAIRELHASIKDLGERREEFRTTVNRLQEMLGGARPPESLPENL